MGGVHMMKGGDVDVQADGVVVATAAAVVVSMTVIVIVINTDDGGSVGLDLLLDVDDEPSNLMDVVEFFAWDQQQIGLGWTTTFQLSFTLAAWRKVSTSMMQVGLHVLVNYR